VCCVGSYKGARITNPRERGKAQRIDAPVISEQTYKQAMKEYNKEQRAKMPSFDRKFAHWLREKKIDKYDQQITDAMYPVIAGAALWNPIIGLTNDYMILTEGKDIYGEDASSGIEKGIAVFDALSLGTAKGVKYIPLMNRYLPTSVVNWATWGNRTTNTYSTGITIYNGYKK